MMTIINKIREIKMSILNDIKNIYSNIPKQEPKVQPVAPVNNDLMDKAINNLNKQPVVAPNINRKQE